MKESIGKQFNLKQKIRIGRNHISSTTGAVAIVAANLERGLFAQGHDHDAFIPPLDYLTDSNDELKRTTLGDTAVKLLPAAIG